LFGGVFGNKKSLGTSRLWAARRRLNEGHSYNHADANRGTFIGSKGNFEKKKINEKGGGEPLILRDLGEGGIQRITERFPARLKEWLSREARGRVFRAIEGFGRGGEDTIELESSMQEG